MFLLPSFLVLIQTCFMDIFFLLQLPSVVPVKFPVCTGTLASAALSTSVVGSHKLFESSWSIFLPYASKACNPPFFPLIQCNAPVLKPLTVQSSVWKNKS